MDNEPIIKSVLKYQTDTLEELMNKARQDERTKIINRVNFLLENRTLKKDLIDCLIKDFPLTKYQ